MRYIVSEPPMTEVAPGIQLSEIAPGGKQGPNGEVLLPTRGGQVWLESWLLGSDADPFRLAIPDVRMPAPLVLQADSCGFVAPVILPSFPFPDPHSDLHPIDRCAAAPGADLRHWIFEPRVVGLRSPRSICLWTAKH